MLFNPYLAQRLAQERTQQAAREAERARMCMVLKGQEDSGFWATIGGTVSQFGASVHNYVFRRRKSPSKMFAVLRREVP